MHNRVIDVVQTIIVQTIRKQCERLKYYVFVHRCHSLCSSCSLILQLENMIWGGCYFYIPTLKRIIGGDYKNAT